MVIKDYRCKGCFWKDSDKCSSEEGKCHIIEDRDDFDDRMEKDYEDEMQNYYK